MKNRPCSCQERLYRPLPPCPPQRCGCGECCPEPPVPCAPEPCCPTAPCRPPVPCPPPVCRTPMPCACGQRPLPSGGVLLPRIIAAGREWQRRCSLTLAVDGLPVDLEGPLTLLEVTACGQPSWETLEDGDPRCSWLRARIPLSCLVRDRCNRCYTGSAAITVDVRLRHSHARAECWRSCVMVLPCVRLICVPCAAERPVFDVLLEVLVEAYMTRWEACFSCATEKPACPDLPLFPQPCFQ